MLSERRWKMDAVVALMAGIVFCISVGSLLMMALKQLAPQLRVADESFYSFLIGTVTFHGLALAQTHIFLKYHEMSWAEFLGWKNPDLTRVLLFAAGIAVLALPVEIMLNGLSAHFITLLHEKPATPPNIKIFEISTGPIQRLLFAFAAIVVAPVVEEILFRGILYPAIKLRGHPHLALFGTGLLFAGIHFSAMNFLPLFILAIIFAKLYDRTACLLAPIVAHAVFNAINVSFFLKPEWAHWLERFGDHLP